MIKLTHLRGSLIVFILVLLTFIWMNPNYIGAQLGLIPKAPSNITINDKGNGKQLELTWEKPKNGTISDYRIYRSTEDSNFEWIATVQTTNFSDSNLEEGKKYYYRISTTAENNLQSVPSASVSGIPTKHPPKAPKDLYVKYEEAKKTYTLGWSKNEEEDVEAYKIYKSDDGLNFYYVTLVHGITYEVISQGESETSFYRISAMNTSKQESNLSIPIQVIIEDEFGEKNQNIIRNHQFRNQLTNWESGSLQTIKQNEFLPATFTFVEEGYRGEIKNAGMTYQGRGGAVKIHFSGSNNKSRSALYQRRMNVTPNGEPVHLSFAYKNKGTNLKKHELRVEIIRPDSSRVTAWQNNTLLNTDTYRLVEELNVTHLFTQSGTYELRFWINLETNTNATYELSIDEVYLNVPRGTEEVPSQLEVEPLPEGQSLKLSWLNQIGGTNKTVGYHVYRSAVNEYGNYQRITNNALTTSTFLDTNVQNNVTYYYRITAVDQNGRESRRSRHVRGVPNFIDVNNHPHHSYSENTNACASCHITHKGNTPSLMNKNTEAQVCFTCHNGTGSKYKTTSLYTTNTKSFHPVKGTVSAPNGSMECSDCHNPHAGNSSRTSPHTVVGSLHEVSGVSITYGALPFSDPIQFIQKQLIEKESELCLSCHSNYVDKKVETKTTNTAKEFNPQNKSGHYAAGNYQTSGFGGYINGWAPDSPMFCTDCHGSSVSSGHEGVHGSVNNNLLKGHFDERSKGADANNMCLTCHDRLSYGAGGNNAGQTRFKEGNKNLHNISDHRVACAQCHSAIPHGSGRLPALLVTTEDPAPYQKYQRSTNTVIYYPPDGNWPENTCGTNGSCH